MKFPQDPTGWHNVRMGDVALTLKPTDAPTSAWLVVNMANDDGVKTRASWNLYTADAIGSRPDKNYTKTNNISLRGIRDLFIALGVEEDAMPAMHDGDDVTLDEAQAIANALAEFTDVTDLGTELCAYISKDTRGYNESTRFRKAT